MICKNRSTNVRVIDKLGNDCFGNPVHIFDLNNVAFDVIGSDGASCSGLMNVEYQPVDCISSGLVKGGVKVISFFFLLFFFIILLIIRIAFEYFYYFFLSSFLSAVMNVEYQPVNCISSRLVKG